MIRTRLIRNIPAVAAAFAAILLATNLSALAAGGNRDALLDFADKAERAAILNTPGMKVSFEQPEPGNPEYYKRPLTPEEAKKKKAEDLDAYLESQKTYRTYRYLFLGGGAISGKISQGGNSSTETTGAYTLGIDSDGLLNHPLGNFEITTRGSFGDITQGDTMILLFAEIPFYSNFPGRGKKLDKDIQDDFDRKPFPEVWMANKDRIRKWADQYYPIRFGIGTGYGVINIAQKGGTQYVNDVVYHEKSVAKLMGFPIAARLGYFGEDTMVRVTGYYINGNKCETGLRTEDTTPFSSGKVDLTAETGGTYYAGRLDIYRRFTGWIRDSRIITGGGLTFNYRSGKLNSATRNDVSLSLNGTPDKITFPELDFRQFEVLATVGYLW